MADSITRLRGPFESVLEPATDRGEYDLAHEVESRDEPPDMVMAELVGLFEDEPAVQRIGLRVEGVDVGIATRASVGRTSGLTAGVGDGDGLTFPIDTAEYRALAFTCSKCSGRVYRSFYDARRIPQCHGTAMTFTAA